ncbi:hypothetical protein ACO1KB_01065 [Leptospira interrogans serovar Szwajizak]|uniref:hypothetical protein n=1 Tax=Leptospira interrogans TaxID=173 RepID=UPI000349586A|nr:hypothetical protein [Leptospira interrogans]
MHRIAFRAFDRSRLKLNTTLSMDRVVGTKFHRGLVVIPTRLILRYNTCGVDYWLLMDRF